MAAPFLAALFEWLKPFMPAAFLGFSLRCFNGFAVSRFLWLRRFYACGVSRFQWLRRFYACGVSRFNFVEGFAVQWLRRLKV
ncbi:MAG: hypothetical protein II037_06775 [Bacteroidales bacterium]|nr:hypothetical protein [Bacteroidales bacterium]